MGAPPTGQRRDTRRLWWTVCVLALTAVVGVAGHYYGPEDGAHPEDGSPAGRHPSD